MRLTYITTALSVMLAVSISVKSMENPHSVLPAQEAIKEAETEIELIVYKSKNCGCCKKWIEHINESGIKTKAIDVADMRLIKAQYQIKPNMRSCHSAVSADGYVFEGHVPAKYIKQFLAEQHPQKTIGLTVPAMPVGTPGMEMGNRFHKYNIEVLTQDSQQHTYKHISKYAEQF